MNILAGAKLVKNQFLKLSAGYYYSAYLPNRKTGVEGRVEINGSERNLKTFRKQSAFITQEDHLLQDLTVEEYVVAAAHLKLGNGVSESEKKSTVSLLVFLFNCNYVDGRFIYCFKSCA